MTAEKMDTGQSLVLVDKREDVAYLTLNAPPVNIMTAGMMGALQTALEEAGQDPALKAVAISACGKAFSAGADVGEHHPEKAKTMIGSFSRLFQAIDQLELPLVMAVDGAALGAGFELAMMADVLLASQRATFGQPEIRLGFFAPVGVAFLPALVGRAKALEITCSGRTYSAQEMAACGLVSRVVPAEELTSSLEDILGDFRKASPLILRMNVRTLKKVQGMPFEEGRREAERIFLTELMATEEVLEGIASFYEKRRPRWKNR